MKDFIHILCVFVVSLALAACGNTLSKALGSVKSVLEVAPAIVEDFEKNVQRVEQAVEEDHGDEEPVPEPVKDVPVE